MNLQIVRIVFYDAYSLIRVSRDVYFRAVISERAAFYSSPVFPVFSGADGQNGQRHFFK